ncbi:histone family protein DNA-binding protein [Moraxella macacae 0408225]|uniref:Histone family protein DNA-binding protein n=1 Tax=Moraxella macacae 0408225 TaxID=1230338 RepID=L2F5Q1_9GAMM|nr:HU family DNA-binding protein [Moraxella macacae]ELA08394.1 histone family protein DNA-binding protein [Moraxella macacae 0408225]
MNKSELVASIAKKSGLSQAQSADALNAFISTVGEALQAGDSIALVGFGTFAVKERAARTGRNPQTGEEMQIPASKVPNFKAGKGLKDAVNPAPKKAPAKGKKK